MGQFLLALFARFCGFDVWQMGHQGLYLLMKRGGRGLTVGGKGGEGVLPVTV